MSYLLVTYHWLVLSRPQVAGFECPVTLQSLYFVFYIQLLGRPPIDLNRFHLPE